MTPAAPATALLVIDMQRDFLDPRGYAAQAGIDVARLRAVIAPVRRLIDAARAAGVAVLHTREGHAPDLSDCPPAKLARSIAGGAPIGAPGPLGRLLVRGEFGHDIVDELQPAAGEPVIDKPGYSAFHATGLHGHLQGRGITHLVLCGVTTEVCVHSTLRAAIDHGYHCTLVADACAASEPRHQAPALGMVGVEGGIFGRVAPADDVIAAWRPQARGALPAAQAPSPPPTATAATAPSGPAALLLAPLPPALQGLWRRIRLAVPAEPPHALDDTTTRVAWLQTPHWHADLRVPAARPSFDGVASLAGCSDVQLRWLLTQEGFAGITTWDGHACTWHRVVDHAASLDIDAGRIAWCDDGCDEGIDEWGVHASYFERWERDADTALGPFDARALAGPGGSLHAVAVRTGRWAIALRPRRLPAAPARRIRAAAAAGQPVPVSELQAAADFEISLAEQAGGGWTVRLSTLPWREGQPAWPGTVLDDGPDGPGLPAAWPVLPAAWPFVQAAATQGLPPPAAPSAAAQGPGAPA